MSVQARKAALSILSEVSDGGSYLNLSLKKHLPQIEEPENRRFAAALVSTTIQNILRIDYVITQFVHVKRVHKIIQNILRLGVCQLMFFESVPVSAAVNESVKLAEKSGKKELKGFVNGVLRNIAGSLGSVEYPNPDKQPADFLSVFYSYPKWLCEKYILDYGFDFTLEMLSYNSDTTLTAVRLFNDAIDSIDESESFLQGKYYMDARYIKNAVSIQNMPLYIAGKITPQSESSMLCVHAAGIKTTDEVLDVCAAPGGKSAYASEMCRSLTAMDIHPHRVELIRQTFSRLNISNATAMEGDGTVFISGLERKYDVVLIDAPCSALGLLYRKPDIKIHKNAEDIPNLIQIQRALLSNCAKYVKTGGKLLYTTCTINQEENQDNAKWFLKNNQNFSLDDFSTDIPKKLAAEIKNGSLQLFPHIDEIDGFFIVRFRRND